ncbi:hypothetical protein ACFLQR_02355 [Verrucomicrobiota bacterium]
MKKNLYILMVFAFVAVALAGGGARQKWIETKMVSLKNYKVSEKTPAITLSKSADSQTNGVWIYYANSDGLLRLGKTNWVLIVTHSFHADEMDNKANDSIGDIFLARDQDGNFYRNDGHPCKCMILKSQSSNGWNSVSEFLKTTSMMGKTWTKLENPQQKNSRDKK